MPEKKPNRKPKESETDPSARIAELEKALEEEKHSHLSSRKKLEREIDDLRDLLIQATSTESLMELELQKRIERLEMRLQDTSAKLARANKKAANLWMQKVDLQTRTAYSPFSKVGWVLMSVTLIALVLVTLHYAQAL